jgi:hypothetical protein
MSCQIKFQITTVWEINCVKQKKVHQAFNKVITNNKKSKIVGTYAKLLLFKK